ncbi:MAG TPA: nucleotidyltransferase domain-containing protein [Patescibacteria group bacterium]|nr:nucleotidyltransferase domain-containing protein [Patescibacteria group bacterium]
MTRQQMKKIILRYINKITKYGIPVRHVFVFGSTIEGTMHIDSDIDTCIISPIFGKDRQKERVILMNLREGISDLIEPHPYSEKDFQNPYDSFSSQIQQKGLKII